jgi:hypothetical protein
MVNFGQVNCSKGNRTGYRLKLISTHAPFSGDEDGVTFITGVPEMCMLPVPCFNNLALQSPPE